VCGDFELGTGVVVGVGGRWGSFVCGDYGKDWYYIYPCLIFLTFIVFDILTISNGNEKVRPRIKKEKTILNKKGRSGEGREREDSREQKEGKEERGRESVEKPRGGEEAKGRRKEPVSIRRRE
jgi:hypothetical protein